MCIEYDGNTCNSIFGTTVVYIIQKLILSIRVEIKYVVCPKELLEEGKTVMFKILAVLLVVLSACVGSGELHTAVDESGCPPWTYRPNSTSPCQCGSSVRGTIQCNITTGVLSSVQNAFGDMEFHFIHMT